MSPKGELTLLYQSITCHSAGKENLANVMGNDQVKWEASCWNVKISLYEIIVSGSGTERII